MSYGFLIYSRKKVVPMERIGISLRSTFFINDEFLTDFDSEYYSSKKVVPMERIGISLRSTFFINDEFLTDFVK